jgi:Fe2+ or Zn2+ uptake regulation protein
MVSVHRLIKLFKIKGLRITPQRRVIFNILSGMDNHPTADMVYLEVQKIMPEVSRATVYNTLHELVRFGALSEVGNLNESALRYDTKSSPHHHIYCVQCHTISDIEQTFNDLVLPPEKTAGFEIQQSQVTFFGLCPDCQKEVKEKEV